jgi:hypothetical protein
MGVVRQAVQPITHKDTPQKRHWQVWWRPARFASSEGVLFAPLQAQWVCSARMRQRQWNQVRHLLCRRVRKSDGFVFAISFSGPEGQGCNPCEGFPATVVGARSNAPTQTNKQQPARSIACTSGYTVCVPSNCSARGRLAASCGAKMCRPVSSKEGCEWLCNRLRVVVRLAAPAASRTFPARGFQCGRCRSAIKTRRAGRAPSCRRAQIRWSHLLA